ncbi:MAG: tetratricopeptide repeat protein [Sphingomonadaceae bacterium]|nr:tetratricopeptide repeat protein [Sphingomonadaceae bacterium]
MALPPENTGPAKEKPGKPEAPAQDTFMREVDDALRQDELEGFFKRYGIPLLAAIIVGLSGLGGYLWWQSSQKQAADERGEQFIVALDQLDAGARKAAYDKLAPVIEADGTASAVAAKLVRAGIALEENRPDEAALIYSQVAEDKDAPQPFRDLANLRYVAARFDEMKPQEVIDRLKSLAVPGNAWFGPAGELVGTAYLEQGKDDLAGPLFANIARDEAQPDTLRGRARQLAGMLGVDALDDVIGEAGEGTSGDKAAPADVAKTPEAQ